ncbi:hypothetical protein AMTR_s00043p00200100 [Amborella trichopoda]|uniref:Uncharacterized protein n=1 Tax=Amborella trichopoda TaxID=13333 RepID=W1PXP8_AMBTC|nr:hypothetical protein AMTR_s00043p00200100 [Amborella trichopoda]
MKPDRPPALFVLEIYGFIAPIKGLPMGRPGLGAQEAPHCLAMPDIARPMMRPINAQPKKARVCPLGLESLYRAQGRPIKPIGPGPSKLRPGI